MPNYATAANCVCPYYRAQGKKTITCEGLLLGTDLVMRFAAEEAKDRWMEKTCCSWQYAEKCPIAKQNRRKYDAEPTE